jgi:hypothetical protein
MKRALALVFLIGFAGCQRAESPSPPTSTDAAAQVDAVAAPASTPQAASGEGSRGGGQAATAEQAAQGRATVPASGMAPTTPMLAYSYNYQIQAASDRARALMVRHQQACVAAGPLNCQVISSNQSRTDEDQFNGELQMRAAPQWLDRFRGGLDGDAASVGGRVVSARTDSEDLTRQIVDTDAALRAQTTLRTRLEQLLATRQGELSDLLEVERELARVQTEIDSTQSELAVMRTRVATSTVTMLYGSQGVLARPGVFQPVTDAVNSSLHLVALSIGILISLVSGLLVPVAVIIAVVWLIRRIWPGLGRRKSAVPAPSATPPDAA